MNNAPFCNSNAMFGEVISDKLSLNRTRDLPCQEFALLDNNVFAAIATSFDIPLSEIHKLQSLTATAASRAASLPSNVTNSLSVAECVFYIIITSTHSVTI